MTHESERDYPAHWFRLYTLEDVSSPTLLDEEAPACPICGAPALRTFLRAGLASFVAALVCIPCRSMFRAADAFSLREDT